MDRTRSEERNLAAAFADELTQILGGVAGAMEIVAQRDDDAHGDNLDRGGSAAATRIGGKQGGQTSRLRGGRSIEA
ncbi:MAG TPA: hypothetical protein VGG86_13095 [Roseiarcus sp.]